MVDPFRVRFTGPLTKHRRGLWQDFVAHGYRPCSARALLHLAAHLSRWLEGRGLSLNELTPERVEAYFRARRRAGYTRYLTGRALRPILGYLEQAAGLSLPVPLNAPASALEELLAAYTGYLLQERGLAAQTVQSYRTVARQFLQERFGREPIEPRQLGPRDVVSFVLRSAQHYSTGTTQRIVNSLRAFLRYLHLEGKVSVDLSGTVPAVAGWRVAGVPKALDAVQVRRVLRSCDRRRHEGRRAYALILLMMRLGLRVGEAAALRLEDIDWVGGEILVRGKGNRVDRLPLPSDVGEALARYLRSSRPDTPSRHVFQRVCAPHGALSNAGVNDIVRQHLLRAGVRPAGTQRLRHTAATQMLRAGASLDDIAQVLRHRSHDTTAIYAKVNRAALYTVVQPWPGGVS